MPALAGAEPGNSVPSRNVTRFCQSRAKRRTFAIYGVSNDETDLSTKPSGAQAPPWLPRSHGNQGRHQSAGKAPRQGPQTSERLTHSVASGPRVGSYAELLRGDTAARDTEMRLVTLKKRGEFLKVRGGNRWSTPSATVECKRRNQTVISLTDDTHISNLENGAVGPPRFGFTVTKKLGNAVIRNRIRRRLKSAITELSDQHARPGFDYVLIARGAAFDRPFAALKKDLEVALQRVHHPRRKKPLPPNGERT